MNYFIKETDTWNPKLFNKKVIITLKSYVCDIGIISGYYKYAKYNMRRALEIKGYSGYCNTYAIDLDKPSIGLDFIIISERQYDIYKKLFNLTKNSASICEKIQTDILNKNK